VNARSVRGPLFILAALAVAACGAILGIEDRFPDRSDASDADSSSSQVDGALETGESDGGVDAPIIPDAACDPAACATIGGTCNGACVVQCTKNCDGVVIACPDGLDCQIVCSGDGCLGTRCTGGRSCTFECGQATCAGISCQSAACHMNCKGIDSCKTGVLSCDAGSCSIDCAGSHSCEQGISARGEQTCAITCTGESSCGAGGGLPSFSCTALEASVLCGSAKDTCKDGIPTCSGAACEITCLPTDSCEDGYCCDAGTCSFIGDGAVAKLCN
jgi:hypothetical protein